MKPDDFFSLAKKSQADMVDLKFVDMLGTWQHCSFPIDLWDEDTFKEGLGFDGSSIRGWMGIHESDMLAMPDADTACIDPFFAKPTVSVIANVVDPVTGKDFSRDPRNVARKAEAHLKETGVADTCFIGPDPNSSSSTRFVTSRTSTGATTRSIQPRAPGTRRASRSRTSDTSRASRAATFR